MRRIRPWGDARVCVAQFLANLWQGPCAVVLGMDAGATVLDPHN
jgi:hypothetical protein